MDEIYLMGNKLNYYKIGEDDSWPSRSFSKEFINNKLKAKVKLLQNFQNIKLLIDD